MEGTPVSWSSLGASASAASEDSHLLNKTEKDDRIRPRSQEGSPVPTRSASLACSRGFAARALPGTCHHWEGTRAEGLSWASSPREVSVAAELVQNVVRLPETDPKEQ